MRLAHRGSRDEIRTLHDPPGYPRRGKVERQGPTSPAWGTLPPRWGYHSRPPASGRNSGGALRANLASEDGTRAARASGGAHPFDRAGLVAGHAGGPRGRARAWRVAHRRPGRTRRPASADDLATDLAGDPHPLVVAWCGPLLGVLMPLAAWGIASWLRLSAGAAAPVFRRILPGRQRSISGRRLVYSGGRLRTDPVARLGHVAAVAIRGDHRAGGLLALAWTRHPLRAGRCPGCDESSPRLRLPARLGIVGGRRTADRQSISRPLVRAPRGRRDIPCRKNFVRNACSWL